MYSAKMNYRLGSPFDLSNFSMCKGLQCIPEQEVKAETSPKPVRSTSISKKKKNR